MIRNPRRRLKYEKFMKLKERARCDVKKSPGVRIRAEKERAMDGTQAINPKKDSERREDLMRFSRSCSENPGRQKGGSGHRRRALE